MEVTMRFLFKERTSAWNRICRSYARLRATIAACEQLEIIDDDGKLAIVSSERLQRLKGVAWRNKADLENGEI